MEIKIGTGRSVSHPASGKITDLRMKVQSMHRHNCSSLLENSTDFNVFSCLQENMMLLLLFMHLASIEI